MKKTQKILSVLLVLITIFGISAATTLSASAAGSSMSNATSISFGQSYSDSITDSSTQDFYKFTMSSSGKINIKLTAYIYCANYYIYDSNGKDVWHLTYEYWNNVSKQYDMDETVDLTSGTYYFAVKQYDGTGNYNFRLNFTSANESFKETTGGTNNTITAASSISTNSNYYGQIANNDDCDFYKFTLSTSGSIRIKLTAYIYCSSYYIYDSNGKDVWHLTYKYWNDVSKQYDMDETVDLTSGTYYFAVKQYDGTGNYNFRLNFTSANESFKETTGGINNTMATASSISINKNYYGQIASNDDCDFYKFTLSSSGKINIKLTAYIYRTNYYIYDSNGKNVWSSTSRYWNDVSKKYDMDESIDLSSGTYYFAVKQNSGTGNYNFIISTNGGTVVTSYKLSYNANGGSGAPSTQTGSTSYTISSTKPVRSGYKFLGWSESSSATAASYTAGDRIKLNKDTTLYAVWQKESVTSYKLMYDANGGSGAPATQTGSTSYIISSVEPVRSGYNFLGWSENRSATAASFTAGDKVTLNGDATLYAVWEKQQDDTPPSDNSGFSILGFFVMILEVFVDIFLAIFSIFA